MQHTDKYNLNIIEASDKFGPEPLNENARTLETQLDAEKTRVDAALAALTQTVTANKSAADTALAAKAAQTALTALTTRVTALEQGRLICATGTYTGNGGSDNTSPTRVELPFKPILLIITDPSAWSFGGFPWLYGQSTGISYLGGNGGSYVSISWHNKTVTFNNSVSGATAAQQLNENKREYKYFILGAAE